MNRTSKRRVVLVLAVVVALLFLVRPGANRLKSRIANSMSMALGRKVEIGNVSVHVLPQPGFDLENLVIHDDPAISAEPMVWAGEVSAALRLSSIFRGRLEISKLSLTEPSFNLARTTDGRWNLEGLVEQAARSPVAPTAKTAREPRPAFPYIEASRARINIKLGQEKKAFSFTEADVALWQESENTWGVRLRAKPVRTDFNLSDTGLLRVNGTWQRASSLRETPLQFTASWQGAQLGQVTKLVSGRDRGWRGGLEISAALSGKPSDLAIRTQAEIRDFRRYDIMGGRDLRLSTACSAQYHSALRQVQDLECRSAVEGGTLQLTGTITDPLGSRALDLRLRAERIPAQAMVRLVQRAKKGLPEGLASSGTLQAELTAQKEPGSPVSYDGRGRATGITLGDADSDDEVFDLGKIEFVVGDHSNARKLTPKTSRRPSNPGQFNVTLLPFAVALDRPAPAIAGGTLARSGYSLTVDGEGRIQRVLQLARLLGIPVTRPPADGIARLNMTVAGAWAGFAPPRVEGTAQLRAVRAEIRGTSAPLDISSAHLTITDDVAKVDKLTASVAGENWTGSIVVPRKCAAPEDCFAHFDLHADAISTDEMNKFLAGARKRPWYRVLTGETGGPSPLATLRAAGTLRAGRLTVHKLPASNATAKMDLDNGTLRLSEFHAQVLGGTFRGNWKADFNGKPATYTGDGKFDHISLEQLTALLGGDWATGTGSGEMRVKAAGSSMAALQENAEGVLQFDVHGGRFNQLVLPGKTEPVTASRFTGRLERRDARFEIQDGKLQTPDGVYQIAGTVSGGTRLNLKLAQGGMGYAVTGSLSEPRVVTEKTTQAALKP